MTLELGLLLWLVGALAGSMVFFGAVVAPMVFRTLPGDLAGQFLRAFFPRYYLWGVIVAAIAAALGLVSDWVSGVLCVLVTALFVYARQSLMPKINLARDAASGGDSDAATLFETLHRRSVLINGLQLIVLVAIAGRLVW